MGASSGSIIRLAGVAQIVLIQRNKAPREAQSGMTLSGGGIERSLVPEGTDLSGRTGITHGRRRRGGTSLSQKTRPRWRKGATGGKHATEQVHDVSSPAIDKIPELWKSYSV